MTVADRIKQRRKELNLSQEELAAKMGYASKSAVSRTENAGDDIGTKRVIAFAKALECTASDLMGWNDVTEHTQGTKDEAMLLYYKYLQADKKTRKIVDQLLEEGD